MSLLPLNLLTLVEHQDKSSPFKNSIRNQYRHLYKWARRTSTNCFRIYDRQVPYYPIAIDYYAGRFCVQYFAPSKDREDVPAELIQQVTETLHFLFAVEEPGIYWRTRSKSKQTRQYEKLEDSAEFFTVLEYGVKFRVNLRDYLDTGLFLDHRETRQLVASMIKGKRLLNLFAYTCSFSVHAAIAGALFTKSVDLSNTYTAWGKENFILNSLPLKQNPIIRADCLKFLKEELSSKERYDLIIIDPPTISRSKKMDDLFEIQRDYIFLIEKSLDLLNPEGVLLFSTNSRKFIFDEQQLPSCSIQEISHKTRSIDFKDPKIPRCWKITQITQLRRSHGTRVAIP